MFQHQLFHVRIWTENPFTGIIRLSIRQTVQNFHAQVAHADFISIWKAECKPYRNGAGVFANAAHFSADILGWLLYF